MSENPESAVLRAIAELEAEDRAEPWFVKYERAALSAGRELSPMWDPASCVFGGPRETIPDGPPLVYGYDYYLGWTEGAPALPYVEIFAADPPAEPYTIDTVRRALDRIAEINRTVRRLLLL